METIKVEGGQLIDRVKQLIHEGNVRRVIVKQGEHTVVEFPLTIGVVGALLAPALAALGAVAALITECMIEVERSEELPAMPTPTEEIEITKES
jgi:hypothetical protein